MHFNVSCRTNVHVNPRSKKLEYIFPLWNTVFLYMFSAGKAVCNQEREECRFKTERRITSNQQQNAGDGSNTFAYLARKWK